MYTLPQVLAGPLPSEASLDNELDSLLPMSYFTIVESGNAVNIEEKEVEENG